jgi:hypothetical protein
VILLTVGLVHVLALTIRGISLFSLAHFLPQDKPTVLKIRQVKTQTVEHKLIKALEGVLGAKATPSKSVVKGKPFDLSDLGMNATPPTRPGQRPEVKARKVTEMNRVSLKNKDFKDFSKSFPSGGLAISDIMAGAQKINDAIVSIEVPEGVNPDELNEYELMFYGFQRRVAMNYTNSILKQVNQFQKKHPRYRIPNLNRITMTARITYDKEGNVMQIKMIRWTHVNELQGLFEEIVKGIDQLHNPPKTLWEKNGEFSMFYTLEILNG